MDLLNAALALKCIFRTMSITRPKHGEVFKFVTDCLQKFVGSVKSIEGEAEGLAYYGLYRPHKFL
uniref:Uncharacterized protein n=1 Tax=Magallana gigas TaxID=29159 RepID=K1Q3C1_MAGGI